MEWVERFVPVLWLWLLLLFWEAPSAAGAFVHFLLGAISGKVVGTLADKAMLLLLLISLDGLGHPYRESALSVICLTKKRDVEAREVL